MTASCKIAGAVSYNEMNWHAIDWAKSHQIVRRLQTRIVKAMQEGRWNKVKALQHLLTRSFSAKALAVKRMTENHGKKTPGIDRDLWDTPGKKMRAIGLLRKRGYHPQPLRRIYIPKKGKQNKKRPLSIPTLTDRAFQALHLQGLDPIAETLADRNSYGFRRERSTADAIEQCFNTLAKKKSAQWILEADIHSCFDQISHGWLVDHIPMDKVVLKKWLKSGFIDKGTFFLSPEGTPQGGIASPVMCNMTLDGLEKELETKFGKKNSLKSNKNKVNLVRYCDDFIITGDSKELLEKEVVPLVEQFLALRGLELSKEKTGIIHIKEGFDFLGQNVRKYADGKLIIKPSQDSIKSHLTKIRQIAIQMRQAPTEELIKRLNPIIRGWAHYHCHVVSAKTFSKIDSQIFHTLWQWAKRRHPNKPRIWIRKKYFQSVGRFNYTLTGLTKTGEWIHLFRTTSVPIKRHPKIKGTVNPYDPKDEAYFDQRLGQKWFQGEKGRRKLRRLWVNQKGNCPLCHQKIRTETGWDIHHILARVYGGTDLLDNLILLHPNCHRQLHHQGFTVAKPDSPSKEES